MSQLDPALAELAATYGVATDFWDWQGRHVEPVAETIVAVLAALGVAAGTPELARAALADRDRDAWSRILPPCIVTREGIAATVALHITHGDPVQLWIESEDGTTRSGVVQHEDWTPPRELDGRLVGQATFGLPDDLLPGYHTLHAQAGTGHASAPLVITPAWLGLPERIVGRRTWGLATQLYSVRSAGSWGVGDLADLADLAAWSGGEHGAGYILVNPLHAAAPVPPMQPSPYFPATRRFTNPIYLRPEYIPEFAALDAADRTRFERLRARLHAEVDDVDAIERDVVWARKRAALELIFTAGRSAGRQIAFDGYCRREGEGLTAFATWCAIADHHGGDWTEWPEPLRHPASVGVATFRADHASAVEFHCWLQWMLDEQLDAATSAGRRAGMPLGVLHDLAVGVDPHGADAWGLQDALARGVTVGAPPDAYNQNGQDWAQPPWRPDRLEALAYAPFREMVATILRHAGGVRVDHIIGLFRLWWIPAGAGPQAGTYVRYNHEALVGILALEAQRAGATVVGEDLGTVEPWARDFLRERGILGTSILWFENDEGGRPLPPERWREYCLASVTTHDLPPTAGYLAGDHVRLRESLGLLTRPLAEEVAFDAADQQAWLHVLREHGLLDDGDTDVQHTVLALHRFLALTPARLLGVSLTDVVGDRRAQNQPGTIDEYPNWRVPLCGPDGKPVTLEQVFASPFMAQLAAAMRGA